MKYSKDNLISLIGTLLFHIALLVILWFTVIRAAIPEEEGGIMVNFGTIDAGNGTFEPTPSKETPKPQPISPTTPPETPKTEPEKMISQDLEESVNLAQEKAKKEKERKQREKAEKEKRAEEERIRKEIEAKKAKQKAIQERVAGAFGSSKQESQSQGDSSQTKGNQGSPFGNSDQGANEGVGGMGSFSLEGRSLGSGKLPRPEYTVQEEGRIVVNITVNPNGNVIGASIGRGTNIDNSSMRKSALDAAKKTKFNAINSTNNQSGTITYTYRLH